MLDIDLYNQYKCLDCLKPFEVSGSTAINLIICPKCQSKNYEHIKKGIKPIK